MTAIPFGSRDDDAHDALQVWRCDACHCFHLLSWQTLLTLTPEEFTGFAHEVADCYCVQMLPGGISIEHLLEQKTLAHEDAHCPPRRARQDGVLYSLRSKDINA